MHRGVSRAAGLLTYKQVRQTRGREGGDSALRGSFVSGRGGMGHRQTHTYGAQPG